MMQNATPKNNTKKSIIPKIIIAAVVIIVIGVVAILHNNKDSTTNKSNVADTTSSRVEGVSATIKAEVWADNWFALYANDKLVKEDSVPITTERSFNSESFTFTASYPLQLSLIIKDYKENDTGLEYIGTSKQQRGDGGFIAQFTDTSTGKIVGYTSSTAKYLVAHKAPLDNACTSESNPVVGQGNCKFETTPEPDNWQSAGYDDNKWPNVIEYSESVVSPKDGYNEIKWNSGSKLIWSGDLLQDNTVLIRIPEIK